MNAIDDLHAARLLAAYEANELRLQEFLSVVPYETSNKGVWSPALASLFLDVGGLLDSFFRHISPDPYQSKAGKKIVRKNLRMNHFKEQFACGLRLTDARVLVLMNPPWFARPYLSWQEGVKANLEWWTDYNELKHDRLGEAHRATMDTVIMATCALFQLIAAYPPMYPHLLRQGWTQSGGVNLDFLIPLLSTSKRWNTSNIGGMSDSYLASTRLFMSPLNNGPLPDKLEDIRPLSYRPYERLMTFLGKGF